MVDVDSDLNKMTWTESYVGKVRTLGMLKFYGKGGRLKDPVGDMGGGDFS